MRRLIWVLAVLLAIGLAAGGAAQQRKLRAGWIYVGPIGDYGWTHAHDVGRRIAEKTLPWLETTYVEKVPEGQVEAFIDRLIRGGARVIFTTSFGYMDGTLSAAKRHPDIIFAHASGFKRAPNVATYMADFYQVYYLNGLMAGALTRTGKIGYVGAFPIPEVKRHISAFALGVRAVNPRATVHVRWIYEWFNPAAAKEATEALIAEGADVFAFTEDSPTVVQVAAQKGLPSFGHYSPMYRFAPRHVVSGQLVHWEKIYIDFLRKVYNGTYTPRNLQNVDYWWLLAEGAVELGAQPGMPINPVFQPRLKAVRVRVPGIGTISVYDLVFRRLREMSQSPPAYDPFTGPIYDRNGRLRVSAGRRMTVQELITMEWAAPGIVGPWPKEPK
ncbi:MAG: BMP family ABC transporter substrate-binding protein [Armatimonadota bacterium]|nr:BMP family ABC transporter substrate-binding protein [Armatimonadota bacterium]MDR7563170.1 BMP family ABC transporter substrate-binding protein [Armatimonadota bacterium]MDR7567161.1 BMP family ABC transporter substrate-binding protein [Armatimonadota bacterium]MDR7602313.1 BMP family ABC transporter substrate-binding protein [Armatimonadota bacterium]